MINLAQFNVTPTQGLRKTLLLMNELETLAFNNVDFVTWVHRTFNSNCPGCIPGKIWKYMNENFTYVSDRPFDEVLIAPYYMPTIKKGDCDDMSLFSKTCLDIIGGWFTKYMLLGKEKNKFTHIVTFAHRGIYGNEYRDGVILDGANNNFNIIPTKYNFFKLT